jgi:hypothetical protein
MKFNIERPLAITMWDFSWLERRWSGAGFEDWNLVLDDLKSRGYDAIRIDAYPHLLAVGPEREWTLKPEWNQQVWGAPALTRISNIKNNLIDFVSLCKEKSIMVGLSTWFREDIDNTRMNISSAHDHANIWINVLNCLETVGLLDTILYVDLCNEFPLDCWAPFLRKDIKDSDLKNKSYLLGSAELTKWMKDSVEEVRASYPDLKYTYSFCSFEEMFRQDVSFLDFLEPHIWMATVSEFYEKVGYNFERFDSIGYDNLALYGEETYRSNPQYWQKKLSDAINRVAQWSKDTKKPLITTECWGIVDYKDWPLLDWNWEKELCEFGVKCASSTGRWVSISSSNFCEPQFVGMWRDINWHSEITDVIHNGALPEIE